ncbi:MAG: choice-of-anchor D domain-containing protein, partial [Bacteroidales bacterium]
MDNRDFTTNETILSGDLSDDDNSNVSSYESSRSENSYHIFYRNNTDSLTPQAIIDGFTITGGNANHSFTVENKLGGAFYITGKQIRPTFKNLIIKNNSAKDGGAFYVNATSSGRISPTFTNVKFINNTADESSGSAFANGGAMYIGGNNTNLIVDIDFVHVDFENNSCNAYGANGGAIYSFVRYSGAITLLSFDTCSFVGNSVHGTGTNGNGAAIYTHVLDGGEAYPSIRNTKFCSNSATGLTTAKGFGAAGYFLEGLNGVGVLQPTFINVTLSNNDADGFGDAFYISGSNSYVSLVNTIIHNDDIYETDGGSYAESNSLINTGDPKFVDETNCDYRLKIGSDALGIGDGVNGNNAGLYQDAGEDLPDFTYNSSEVDFGTVVIGYTSTEKNMSISATNVHDKLYLIAPDDVELTLTSGDYSGNTDTIGLTSTDEEIATTTIYYRYVPSVEGTFTDSIQIEADGYSEMKPLTGNAVNNKAIYVKADASGDNDGTSWANAYTNLYDATDNSLMGDTIFVAKGAYTPEASSSGNKFILQEDVQLYGGFAGNESPVTESILLNRDFETNETVLSGDIDGGGTSSGNSYEIIYATGGINGTVIDGFTITGSNNIISNRDYTAIRCYGGNASFRNLILHGNRGYNRGGALYLDNGTFTVDSVQFYDNYVEGSSDRCYGGALYTNNSTVNISNSYFWNNSVDKWANVVGLVAEGGAIYMDNSDVTLINTSFYKNWENGYSGNIYNEGGNLTAINTIFYFGGLFNSITGNADISYSYYHGPLPNRTPDGGNNVLSSSGSYIDIRFVDPENGDFSLFGDSPCLNTGDQTNGVNMGYYQGAGLEFPSITISETSLDFDEIPSGSISEEKSYTVSATNLSEDLAITAPNGFEITLTSGVYEGATDYIALTPTNGDVSETTIYARFAPTSAISYNNSISHTSSGAETKYISASGQGGLLPTISFSGSIYDFGEQEINLPTNSDDYSVYGNNYYDDLYIVAPEGFEISFNYDFIGNTDTLIISPNADGNIPYTEIRVRFNPSEVKEYSDSILHFTKYKQDTTKMHVTGIGIESPTLSVDPLSLDFGDVTYGQYSDELSITISGENLTGNIDLSCYESEMTLTSGDYSGDYTYIMIVPVNGKVDTTVYVRFQSYNYGSYNSNIYISSGFLNETVALSANIVDETLPGISVNKSNIDFGNVIPGEYSDEYTFTVSGYNLEGDINIDAPDYFEITQTSGDYSGNTSNISLTPVSGTVDNEVVYVRFSPTSIGYFSDHITLMSPNADNEQVSVTGTGEDESGDASIYLSEESLSFGDIAVGENSAVQSFNASGENLTNDISLTTSSPFEISLDAEDFSGDVSQIIIPLPEGENGVGATVFVRFSPDEEADFGGSVLVSSGSVQQIISFYGTGVASTTGIENMSPLSVNMYPNPTSNSLYIKTGNNEKVNQVLIYNAIGGVIKE